MTYPTPPMGQGPDVDAGGTDTDGKMWVPGSHANHPSDGPGVAYGRPSQYDGPSVNELAPLVNPSAGDIGAPGGGANPRGPDVYNPGDLPNGERPNAPYPDTTVGNR